MDFGRFKYQESKKEQASRKHQSVVIIKEIKFRPKTDTHDLNFKLKHIRRFLGEGNKVRLMIVFRGREIVHPETGHAMLDVVSKEVADISVIEQKPSMEGRRMVMVLGPRSGRYSSRVGAASAGPVWPVRCVLRHRLAAVQNQAPDLPYLKRKAAVIACVRSLAGYTARLSCPS
jgi:translation initiation factor IF-3